MLFREYLNKGFVCCHFVCVIRITDVWGHSNSVKLLLWADCLIAPVGPYISAGGEGSREHPTHHGWWQPNFYPLHVSFSWVFILFFHLIFLCYCVFFLSQAVNMVGKRLGSEICHQHPPIPFWPRQRDPELSNVSVSHFLLCERRSSEQLHAAFCEIMNATRATMFAILFPILFSQVLPNSSLSLSLPCVTN